MQYVRPLLLVLLLGGLAHAQEATEFKDTVQSALAAHPGGLTADDAATKAAQTSPDVLVSRLNTERTRAEHKQTTSRWAPKASVTGSMTRTNRVDYDFGSGGLLVGALNPGLLATGPCPDGGAGTCVLDAMGAPVQAFENQTFNPPQTTYQLAANVVLPISEYLGLSSALDAAKLDIANTEQQTLAQVRSAELKARLVYYQWLRSVAQVAVTARSQASTEAHLEDAKLGLSGGTLAPADVLQIESAVASAQLAHLNAQSAEALARQNLAILMGTESTSFTIGEDIFGDLEPLASMGELSGLVQEAQKNRPEVQQLIDSENAAKKAIDSSTLKLYPALEGVGNLTYANPNQQFFPPERAWNASWYVGLNLKWAYDRVYDARNELRILEANRRVVAAQRSGVKLGIALEVRTAYSDWQRAATALSLGAKARQAAEAAHEQRVTLFRAGEATATEVIEAELQRVNATMTDIDARISLRIARARLLHYLARASK